ncbi:hypothetical protein FSW04_12420 [Baekduia soli]|uniref:Uncharacterized protein n=1 Tax=Baekduia soli TaxID=496014 RepID=A0A5B8U5B9_9ACTN|nr:hypothetical protein [Baekduia soli]QEC48294.1 hypothetical protein FSW04_12420 [Baekduia soli]
MMTTSRAPRIDGPRDCDPLSGALLGWSARPALPVLRIAKLLPFVGKPANRVVDTAAGSALGGSAEKTARRTKEGSRAMALATGVADGSTGYPVIFADAGTARAAASSTPAPAAAAERRVVRVLSMMPPPP